MRNQRNINVVRAEWRNPERPERVTWGEPHAAESYSSIQSFTFTHSSVKRLFTFSSFPTIRVVSSVYLRLLVFLPADLILVCDLSSPAFHIMYSAYRLNKQGGNIQPCPIPFPILNQSIVPCPILTVGSWPAYRFLRRQIFLSLLKFPTVCCDLQNQKH